MVSISTALPPCDLAISWSTHELRLNLKERTVIQLRVGLFESCVIKIWGGISVRLLFKQEILSVILLSLVLIHCKLMPKGELISNEQKKQASKCPILDLLQVCSVQDNADALLVMFSSTG